MKKALVFGAIGFIGSQLLPMLLASADYDRAKRGSSYNFYFYLALPESTYLDLVGKAAAQGSAPEKAARDHF